MTIFSHALVSMVLIKGLGLQGKYVLTGVAFGNLIDVDHWWVFAKKGLFEIAPSGKKRIHARAHTFMHEPIFILPVAAVTWWLGSTTPLVFWGTHMIGDHIIMKSDKRPFWPVSKKWRNYGWLTLGSKTEWIIDLVLVGVLVWLWFR